MIQSNIIYQATAYTRASKDDADSSTIENQFELIKDYVKLIPEISITSERSDNGFSGVNFLRPSFTEMMKDIEAGKINCVIVKDLSRLGRNYIEVGELMEDVFPRLNVRLISVNDRYDSVNPRSDADDIVIPFKNLINEQYLRDFSVKIRSNLNVKRKKGEFVAAFAPYGYVRDENDKHRLNIDERAASIVRDIFRWKIEGMSQQKIADRLNEIGEPSPSEYKKKQGSKYVAQFQTNTRALWSAIAVGRILHNPVYTGTLVQGKGTTPNYKVKKRIVKPENEWNVAADVHEAIITKSDFETVNTILNQDTRTSPKDETVLPLAGLLYCGDCGNSIVRKKVGKYTYYVCASNKAGKGCTAHTLKPSELESAVMQAVIRQISAALEIGSCLDYLKNLPHQQRNVLNVNEQLADREKEIKDCERYKRSLYEDYKNGDISKEDYIEFGKDYTERIEELRQAADRLRQESELLLDGGNSPHRWIEHFKCYRNVTELSRQLAVSLVDRIDVFEDKRISIRFRYQDKMNAVNEILRGLTDMKAGCL